jgi:hypothetical protein
MTRKIEPLTSYISASEAADLLSKKLGRRIRPDYIRKLKGVRTHKVNATSKLYHRDDILAANVKKKEINHE